MAFGRFPRPSQAKPFADINVTPLVDVMLVLLVIFILTAPLLTSAIRLDLPQAQSSQAGEAPESLTLSLNQAQELFLNDQPVDVAALPQALRRLAAQKPNWKYSFEWINRCPMGRF
jgi:biopolymer transport protein TolR